MNENQAKVRASLLDAVLWFVGSVAGLAGVQRIALIGSLVSERPRPKDVDLVVYVADDADLAPLAAAARRLKGRLQGQNRGADVFLADEQRRYLGRICSWKICQPGVRASCDARNCGRRPYLHDDLATIRLDDSVIAVPLLELWPVVVQRGPIPTDVEELVRRLQQPHNSAFDRAAGSHSLAAAGQRER